MHGTLNLYCLECHEFVEWKKSKFYLDDFYPDWRLDVFCGCGISDDPEVQEIAREAYDDQLYADLETQQQNALDAALIRSGNLYFETLCGGTGPVPRIGLVSSEGGLDHERRTRKMGHGYSI